MAEAMVGGGGASWVAAARIGALLAEVVELVDTQDLGSCAFGREGSSPFFGTDRQRVVHGR